MATGFYNLVGHWFVEELTPQRGSVLVGRAVVRAGAQAVLLPVRRRVQQVAAVSSLTEVGAPAAVWRSASQDVDHEIATALNELTAGPQLLGYSGCPTTVPGCRSVIAVMEGHAPSLEAVVDLLDRR